MVETINPTALLDEAQKTPQTERQEYFTKVKEFIKSTLKSAFNLLLWCIFSLLVIYMCKLAQSNVLPTDVNCYPYTNEKGHEPEKIETQIFTNMFFRKPRKAMTLEFPDSKSYFIDYILKSFKEYKEWKKSSFLGNFFIAIFEPLIAGNNGYYNTMFSFLNQLPEFLLVLFGPYLGLFILGIGVFYNMFSLTYNWLVNLGWMWKKNANIIIDEKTGNIKPGPGAPAWENVRWTNLPEKDNPEGKKGSSEWGSCLLAVLLTLIFAGVIITLLIGPFLLIISVIFSIFFVITFLMYKTKLAGKNTSITELFIYFFKYNKLIIMSFFSFYVISNAYNTLGSTSAGFAVLTLFCIYYFKIIEMFVPIKTDQDERIEVEIDSFQAYKEPCDPPPEKEEFQEDPNLKYASSMDRARQATSFTGQTKKDWGIRKSLPSVNLFGKRPGPEGPGPEGPGPEGSGPGPEGSGPEAGPGPVQEAGPGPGPEPVSESKEEPKLTMLQRARSGVGNIFKKSVAPEIGGPESDRATLLSKPSELGPVPQETEKLSMLQRARSGVSSLKDSASNRFSNLFNRSSSPPVAAPANQTGGKKRKPLQIDSDNLVRELKKFNKKYTQFLL
jgi:hypothetical protein